MLQYWFIHRPGASQVVPVVNNLPANSGDTGDPGLIPGLGRSPGGGHGNPLQYSYLENPLDRGAWWAAVHRVAKSQTELKQLSTHTCIHVYSLLSVYVHRIERDSLVISLFYFTILLIFLKFLLRFFILAIFIVQIINICYCKSYSVFWRMLI